MRQQTHSSTDRVAPHLIWWAIWGATLGSAIAISLYFGLKAGVTPAAGESDPAGYIGLVPFAVSLLLRVLVFPRITAAEKAFVVFVIGIALSEAATMLAVFLGRGGAREIVVGAGLIGIAQWIPTFARGFYDGERRSRYAFRG